MPNKNFVEDMLTLGTGLLSNLAEARHELRAQARQKVGTVARELDLVTREEFDAAFAMIAKARKAQEDLDKRLARIEAQLGVKLKSPKSSAKPLVKTKKTNLPIVKSKPARRGKN